VTFVGRLH